MNVEGVLQRQLLFDNGTLKDWANARMTSWFGREEGEADLVNTPEEMLYVAEGVYYAALPKVKCLQALIGKRPDFTDCLRDIIFALRAFRVKPSDGLYDRDGDQTVVVDWEEEEGN